MKKTLLLISIIIFQIIHVNAQEDNLTGELNWMSTYDEAKRLATEENKPILIFFTGSDWCGICKMLDKDFLATEKFKKIADKSFILYKADFPRRTDLVLEEQKKVNEKLDKKYSKSRAKRSFPTIVITNANGDELGYIESYNFIHDTTRHYGLLKEVLKNY